LNVSGDLTVAKNTTLYDASATYLGVSGITDLTGSCGIDGSALTVQGAPTISGDLSVSGNIYVGGNVFTGITASIASVLNSTGLLPTGTQVPDALDVFQLSSRTFNYNNGLTTTAPFDNEQDFNIPIWNDDRSNVFNYGTAPLNNKSYILSYPTSNINAPTWTSLLDTQANVATAYRTVYQNSSNTYDFTSHYSSVPIDGISTFPVDVVKRIYEPVTRYLIDTGIDHICPDFVDEFKDFFYYRSSDSDCFFGLEFVYDKSNTIPSNVCISFFNAYVPFDGATEYNTYKLTRKQLPYASFITTANIARGTSNTYLQPVTLPVTTDPSVFTGIYDTAGGKSVLFDVANKQFHVYFNGSSNTSIQCNTTAAFESNTHTSGIHQNMVLEMAQFKGSFQIAKKRAMITSTERPFAPCSTSDSMACIYQISPTVKAESNVYLNGSLLTYYDGYSHFSSSFSRNLYDTDAKYAGVMAIKAGFGKPSTDILFYPVAVVNALTLPEGFTTGLINSKTNIVDPESVPRIVLFFNNTGLLSLYRITDYPYLYSGETPETMLSNLATSTFTSDDESTLQMLLAHELSHVQKISTLFNSEGSGVLQELNFAKRIIPKLIANTRWASFDAFLYVTHRASNGFLNNSYTVKKGDLHKTGSIYPDFIPNCYRSSDYGSGLAMYEICEKYDTNNQLYKRANLLTSTKVASVHKASGLPLLTNFTFNYTETTFRLSYDQALRELTTVQGSTKTLPNVFVDYMISSVMLRNNSSIPAKYRTSYPHCVANRRAAHWNALTTGLEFSKKLYAPFSDVEECFPLVPPSSTSANRIKNESIIPIWPKVGSTFSNALVFNNLGKWNSNTAPTLYTYSSNTYISTPLVHQTEDLSAITYVIPTFSDASNLVYGTQNYISNVAVTVGRGDWVFKVVQFIPNGGDGVFTESAAVEVNVPGVYNAGNGGTGNDYWTDGTPQTFDINFTGFNQFCKKAGTPYADGTHVWYFPRLVCVNRGLYDYNPERNLSPFVRAMYTGKITLQATVV
jgi:hypothetical protein